MRALFLIALLLAACTTTTPNAATGEVSTWLAGPPLPTPRANHCSAVIDDWVLVIGGNYMAASGFVKTDEIHAAQLAADGTLGPWQLAGHTASPVSECTATSDGRRLYVIDGIYDTMTDGGKIMTADLDATGHLSTLTAIGALADGVYAISTRATVHNTNLMILDTQVPNSPNSPVYPNADTTFTLRTPLAAVAWATDVWSHLDFRAEAGYAFTDTHAYTLGGYHDPAIGPVADTYVATIAGDASTSSSTPTTPLPTPIANGQANAVDDWVFVVGGRADVFAGGGSTAVYASPIAADGSLGAWQTETALPTPRTNDMVVLVGDYLVLTGGADTAGGDNKVLIAQVRYPAGAH